MAETTIPVEHLFTMTATIGARTAIMGAPQGSRAIANITGGTFEGERLRGKLENSGGDWVTIRADGSLKLDVRVTLTTEDGASILMTYAGIGMRSEGGVSVRSAPLFETGDERYAWLNNVQAIGIGTTGSDADGKPNVTYHVYGLK